MDCVSRLHRRKDVGLFHVSVYVLGLTLCTSLKIHIMIETLHALMVYGEIFCQVVSQTLPQSLPSHLFIENRYDTKGMEW